MTVNGSVFRNYNIPRGWRCPDISTGSSITLEELARKTLEKELAFRQSIVEKEIINENIHTDPVEQRFIQLKQRINRLCDNSRHELNERVRENSLTFLKILTDNRILPSLINPTGDESLLFEFFLGEKYFSIDFYSSGGIVYLHEEKNSPAHVIEMDIEDISDVASDIMRAQTGRGL